MPGRDGLKGKRVGEASNPGPADDQMASTADDSMGIESALEFDLTQLDSDHCVSGSETESCAEELPVGRNATAIGPKSGTLMLERQNVCESWQQGSDMYHQRPQCPEPSASSVGRR